MRFYISENRFFYYEGQILDYYDIHNSYVATYEIKSFVVHRRKDKTKYLSVRLQNVSKTYDKITIKVDLLDLYYRGHI